MKRIMILSGLLSFAAFGHAEAAPWTKTYGYIFDDLARAVAITSDGGFLVAGFNEMFPDVSGQLLAMKLDSSGNRVWSKGYDELLLSGARGATQLQNGRFLVWGYSTPSSETSDDACLILLSPAGDIVMQKAYGVASREEYGFARVEPTRDGGYIGCGWINLTDDDLIDNSRGWIVKLNASGKVVFQKVLTNTGQGSYTYCSLSDIRQTPDGGYICAGDFSTTDPGGDGVWIGKLDAAGNITWQRSWEAHYKPHEGEAIDAERILPTTDGGYFLLGHEWDWRPWGSWCAKLDSSGNVKWTKRVQGDTWDEVDAWDVVQTADGGYMIAGELYKNNADNFAWLAKLSPSGSVTVQRSYILKEDKSAAFMAVRQLPDGGYVFAGRSRTDVWTSGTETIESYAVMVMTTGSDGLTCAGVPPKAYKSAVKSIKLDPLASPLEMSAGSAKVRTPKFRASSVDLAEDSWCSTSEGGDPLSWTP